MTLLRTPARVALAAALAAVAACSAFAGDDGAPTATPEGGIAPPSDASTDAGPTPGNDAAPGDGGDASDADAGRVCTPDMPFGTPVMLPDLGEASSVRLTPDETTAFIAAPGEASEDISEGPFPKGIFNYADVVETSAADSYPAPVTDPLQLFYETDVAGTRAVVHGRRQQPGQKFGLATPILTFAMPTAVRAPWALRSGTVVYVAIATANTRLKIHRAELVGGSWSSTSVGGLASGLDDTCPVVSEDERTIFFARVGPNGSAPAQIVTATRASSGDPFGAVLPADRVNAGGSSDDRPVWLSPDACTLLLASTRSGAPRIYRATR